MNLTHTSTQYSILGTAVRLDHSDGDVLVFHAPLRLGPGRVVSLRAVSHTIQATVLSAHVRALRGECGPTYELYVRLPADALAPRATQSISRPVSPAVGTAASKEGGRAA